MKKIKLYVSSSLKIEGMSLIPNSGEIIKSNFEDIIICRENAGKIIWAAISIEQKLDDIIHSYLFDRHTKKTDFFINYFLKTNRIDFSTKRQVALSALKEDNKIYGKKYSKLEKTLSNINKTRNACAHGNIFESTEHGIILDYYEGGKKSEILTDEYWTKIENDFSIANEIIDNTI